MSQAYYNYTFTVLRSNGSEMLFSFSTDSDTKARLKARAMAKKMNGTVKQKYDKKLAPYKQQDETKQELLEQIMR